MKQTATNSFTDGLNLDLHPLVTPKTVLTDNLNGTFITYNGNEFCLQNDRGNSKIASLTKGYTPIGIKERNGVLYIVSYNMNEDLTEIGTYPGVDWNVDTEKEYDLDYSNYKPLCNYYHKDDLQTIYNIYSRYSGDDLNELNIDIDLDAINNVLNSHNPLYKGSSNLFGDPGPDSDYIYFFSEEERDTCFNDLQEVAPDIFGKYIAEESFGGTLLPMRFKAEYDLNTPITLDIQDSYDGSVNLILVADQVKTRIINTSFSVIGNKYKIIDRNQSIATNYYTVENFNLETELIRTSTILTNVDLEGSVQVGGQLKGGNYTFYIKFGDADFNQTDVVAESGIVSIFNGNDGIPSTVSGTLLDERTDKMVQLKITGLNTIYSKIYIYFTREYSDTQGYRMTECGMLKEPIDMNPENPDSPDEVKYQKIWISGFEQQQEVNIEELNVDYHTIDWARAETQHSNMLFLGNVGQEETFKLYQYLKDWTAENVTVTALESSPMTSVSLDYTSGSEYYSTHNIYYNLGYWPDEIYRFGIVYILNDGSTTPVFNTPGGKMVKYGDRYVLQDIKSDGVILTPDVQIIDSECDPQSENPWQDSRTIIKPLYFNFELSSIPDGVAGWFVVRQKRIPRTFCQGLSIGIDEKSHLPLIYNENQGWDIESFLSYPRDRKTDDELVEEINRLENKTSKLRYILGIAGYLTFLPTIMSLSRIAMIDTLIAEGKLKNIYSAITPAPLLQYLCSQITNIPEEAPVGILSSSYTSEQIYSSFNADFDANFPEGSNAIVDKTRYNQITDGNALIYSCQYSVHIYKKDENSEEGLWTEQGDPINVYYLTDNSEAYPDYLNFTYEGKSMSAEVTNLALADVEAYVNTLYSKDLYDNNPRKITQDTSALFGRGLLSLDPCVNSFVSNVLDGSKFRLIPKYNTLVHEEPRKYQYYDYNKAYSDTLFNKCVFVPSNTNIKVVDEGNSTFSFSNTAGNSTEVSQYKKIHTPYWVAKTGDENNQIYAPITESSDNREDVWDLNNINIVRGNYCPYIGVASNKLMSATVYSVRSFEQNANLDKLFLVREQDNSEYYAVSKRTYKNSIDVFRGDCYTNTVSIRINRNFIDPVAPVAEQIVDEESWAKNVILTKKEFEEAMKDEKDKEKKTVKSVIWDQVNLTDVNTVDLGMWVTFKCLSSYNLGLRSEDTLHTDEMALLGSPRSFLPLRGASTATGSKMEESWLLNDGLSATVGRKRYNLMPDVPYSKSEFANRIMFSNVNITDAFTNGYRTFQGLSYKDYDKQYGAITKLITLGQNIFVVMEHGLGLIPVNPKALMQTTTGETIHIYGYGVLPNEMTIISQDYGSKYEHSVIRTPIGIYGVDTDACKVWRFSEKQGFETISDMKVETYLKEYFTTERPKLTFNDVRTHYNAKKGDIMFAFYDQNDKIKNIIGSTYFNTKQREISIKLGESKDIKFDTNLPDEEVHFSNSENISCSYSNKTLHVTGLTESTNTIDINGITIKVNVISEPETSADDWGYIEVVDYPDTSWYTPDLVPDESKSVYFDVRKIDTFYGMRFSLPVFLKCPNGRPTSSDFSAVYSIDRKGMISVGSSDKSIIDLPKDNHVADNRLYNQCDGYTLPTIVHVSESCFKNTGTVGIRVYNKDKTEYDTCIVNVLNTNPEGTSYSQFEQKNLLWPFNVYVNTNSCFDIWYHHHLRYNQIINIDDPTAIWPIENGYSLQDGVKTNGTNIKLLYCSKQFKAGNKPGTYHITFTCPKTQYYDYSGTYTVTVHVLGSVPPDQQTPDEQNITGIEIQPDMLKMYVGQSERIQVINKPSGYINNNVAWSTSQSPPFTFSKVSNTVTAIREGIGRLIATTNDGRFNTLLVVKASYDAGKYIQVPSTNIHLSVNDEYILDPTIVCEHCTVKPVTSSMMTWTSSNKSIANIIGTSTIHAYGVGKTTIVGKYLGKDDVTITCTVTVSDDEPESEINYGELTRIIDNIGYTEPGGPVIYMTPGTTKVFKTLGNYVMRKEDYPANWSITENSENIISFESEPAVGDLQVTINANTLGTAKLNLQFMAVDRPYVKTSYTWTIHVIDKIILSKQVVISPNGLKLAVGETAKVKVTVFPKDATYKTVAWDTPQGAVVSVNDEGKVTGWRVGKSRLIAKSADKESSSYIFTEVVDATPEESITYDAREREKDGKEPGGPLVYMQLGSTRRFKLTGQWWLSENDYYTRWTIYDQSEDNVISFESDPGEWNLAAMVSANKLGTAKIKMEYVERSTSNVETTYEWIVQVLEQVVYSTSVKINPSSIRLLRGEKYKMEATVFPSNSTYKGVEWWTPQGTVVTVDQNGEIEAVGVGSGRLIATSLDDKSEDWITTTVIDPTITGGAEGVYFEEW